VAAAQREVASHCHVGRAPPISQVGKIIRIDTKTIRSAGRSTSGVKLLNLDPDDKVVAAGVIPPKDAKSSRRTGRCYSRHSSKHLLGCTHRDSRKAMASILIRDLSTPSGEARPIDVGNLLLDVDNPRLAEYGVTRRATQPELAKVLWDKMAVAEVAMSIAYSGFFPYEPLFVERAPNNKFVVIEGNRRLAAVRLLLDADLRRTLRATDLPTIDQARKKSLEQIPCIVTTKKQLWRYLGFKHVNGPATWGSYAKAQYIAHVHNAYDVPLRDIADQIGDTNYTVERMYRGLMIIEQAEEEKIFDRQDIAKTKFPFNYVYTGMDYPGISAFIGTQNRKEPTKRPVPRSKIKHLGELLGWLYGRDSSDKPSLIKSQNPDLKILDGVLLSDEGVSALRNGLPLAVARDISIGDKTLFRQALQGAKENLQKGLGTLGTGYDPSDLDAARLANEIELLAHDLVDGIQKKARERQGVIRRVR
jgi:hypothetical protein